MDISSIFKDEKKPSERGTIVSINNNIIQASDLYGASIFEMVLIGKDELVGEIIKIDGDLVTIQVFEDTNGLQNSDVVKRTNNPLMAELGPGIMGIVYDGLQRPLHQISEKANGNIFIPKGVKVNSLDREKKWTFEPVNFQVGDIIVGGDIYGRVVENMLIVHWIMLPLKETGGHITKISPFGSYTVDSEVLVIKSQGTLKSFNMIQYWPIRTPRPTLEKLPLTLPLLTGLRVLDSIFPLAQGGTGAIPGNMGKTTILHYITKYSNSDAIVYIGSGERGNEVAELLLEMPEITIKVNGDTETPVMDRVCLITNTSNMPVSARESSIYMGLTIAEYIRDMGNNVAVMGDSLSRWAEALSEVSRNQKEVSLNGYPAYLNSRIQQFFQRAGKVICLGNPKREGTLTCIGAVSPPGGDFDKDPVSQATLGCVQTLWSMSRKLANYRHFPSVSWVFSFSEFSKSKIFEEYSISESFNEDFIRERDKIMEILEKESNLEELVLQVGKDGLSDSDQLAMEMARLIRQDFLQQNMFTPYDKYCPIWKISWMLRNFVLFYDLALKEILLSTPSVPIKFKEIKSHFYETLQNLSRMKFEDAYHDTRFQIVKRYEKLNDNITQSFKDFHIKQFYSN